MRLLLILLLGVSPLVLAQESATGQGPDIDWVQWAISSGLVIGSIFILGWLLRRLRTANLLGGHRQLKVVATLNVGQKERVIIVQAGAQQYLLGVTGQQINCLDKLAQPITNGTTVPSTHQAKPQRVAPVVSRPAPIKATPSSVKRPPDAPAP